MVNAPKCKAFGQVNHKIIPYRIVEYIMSRLVALSSGAILACGLTSARGAFVAPVIANSYLP